MLEGKNKPPTFIRPSYVKQYMTLEKYVYFYNVKHWVSGTDLMFSMQIICQNPTGFVHHGSSMR